ncbi:MAG TPA: 3-oxoacyl-ACP reductase FabG [candidate division Zixibacteria bacterium]|nr:3-oxoacyl-ACP reductase FabG [candidate division Zixibacteria bacterium]
MKLAGKTTIITGAARGIGRAIAEKFAAEGANLVLADIDEGALNEVANKLGAKAVVADVSDEKGASKVVATAVETYGSLEILVNNAGITRDALLIRMKPEDFDKVLKVNLRGPFLMSKEAARVMMKARYGKIINMSSVIGMRGNAGQASYTASKGGLIALTMSMAKELGARGIRVNSIAPGYIETEMTVNLSEEVIDSFLNRVILGRFPGKPEDVAETALFLAMPASDYITGAVIPVDGGMLIA